MYRMSEGAYNHDRRRRVFILVVARQVIRPPHPLLTHTYISLLRDGSTHAHTQPIGNVSHVEILILYPRPWMAC